jgi:hypothetical protein
VKTGADTGPCPGCGEPRGGRYLIGGRWLCWPCSGLRPLEPPARSAVSESRSTRELIDRLERALGPAVATPEHRGYRVHRWCCPACGGGLDDPQWIWRPFVVDSDGRVWCEAPGCRRNELEATLRRLVGAS